LAQVLEIIGFKRPGGSNLTFFEIPCHQTGLSRVGLLNAAKRKGKPMTTQTKTSQKISSRSESVSRWSLATGLRLFAICMKLAACEPTVAVPEYHVHAGHIEETMMVTAKA
jgi:hypothetical protein